MSDKKPKYMEETADNDLVYFDDGLLEYGRKAVMRDWDPNTPRVSEEARVMIMKTRKRSFKA